MSRAAQEALPPQVYLSAAYYERWALGLERLLLEHQLVTAEELAAGHALQPGKKLSRKLTGADISPVMTRGSYARPAPAPARFKPGDRVRTANINPITHTRLPRYARGRVGVVERVQGCHVFADSVAIGARRESAMALHRRSSTAGNCGARAAIRRSRSRSRRSSLIWSRRDGEQRRFGSRQAADAVASIPRDADGPVFREPWEAQAFAMAVALHERGLFAWGEWAVIARRGDQARPGARRSRYRRDLLPALARRARAHRRREGRDAMPHARALSRRLGPRRRPHAARHADRARAEDFGP